MTTLFSDDAPTDAMPPARHAARPKLPRFIRAFAVPIVLAWVVIVALLNTVVPQLEEVGKLRAVSMSPNDAPALIATKRVGQKFEEYDTSSSVMIVLEGDEALGPDAHAFYDEVVRKLNADDIHVQHVQDFWGDTLTAAGAQSIDGKAAYVQVYIAGDQGEALANASVQAVRDTVEGTQAPSGVKAYVTGPAALTSDQNVVGRASMKTIEFVTIAIIIAMLLIIYIMGGGLSVTRLFLAGAVPGLLIGVGMMVYVAATARARNFPRGGETWSAGEILRTTIPALPGLGLPVIVLGGILGGFFTPTEAGAIAVIYAVILGLFY